MNKFPFFKGVKLLVSDLDGTLTYSTIPETGFISNLTAYLDEVPTIKRCTLSLVEKLEILLNYYHDKEHLLMFLESSFPYKIIVTDRSIEGLGVLLNTLNKKEQELFSSLNAIQVRKSKGKYSSYYSVPIWESEVIKPHPDIFERVANFALLAGLHPQEVMVADDSLKTRILAKKKYNFKIWPDNTEDMKIKQMSHLHTLLSFH
ncbi:MAG: hypothetical protein V1652_02250 [bacterium]